MATEIFTQNLLKLKESVLYLCLASEDDKNFGVPKLQNILYYADNAAYRELDAPITGTNYLHFPDGPHPENCRIVQVGRTVTIPVIAAVEPSRTNLSASDR